MTVDGRRHVTDDAAVAWWADLPPAAGAAVMATGILSVGLHLVGQENLSRVALALASLFWLGLAADFAVRLTRDPRRWEAEADTPPALTAVAATCVVGTRYVVSGWNGVGAAALVLAAVLWPLLLTPVTRHWKFHMHGAVFLVCVATQGIAVLSGVLSAALPAGWLAWVALVFFVAGLVLYASALVRFEFADVRDGAGDQWIAGGAMAISALAGAKLLASPHFTGTFHDALRAITYFLLACDVGWYAVLLVSELRWPRLHYDIRRWATVFPLGMTAVAVLSVGAAAHVAWSKTPGRVLLWVAVAAWVLAFVGAVRSAARSITKQT